MLRVLGTFCFLAALLMNAAIEAAAASFTCPTIAVDGAKQLDELPTSGPAAAGPLAGSCNSRLEAESIISGGNAPNWLHCNVKGQLKLKGKIYNVFEYQTGGYGKVNLQALEAVECMPPDYRYPYSVTLQGRDRNARPDSLADSGNFTINITDYSDSPVAAQDLRGRCADSFDGQGNLMNNTLESCDGADWSLHIGLAGAAKPPARICNTALPANFFSYNSDDSLLDCDAKGQLMLNGKVYEVFEYRTDGADEVRLSVMEPGFAADNDNFEHVLYVALAGNYKFYSDDDAGLGNYASFTIAIAANPDYLDDPDSQNILLKQVLFGTCAVPFDADDKRTGNILESCDGPDPDWSLRVSAGR